MRLSNIIDVESDLIQSMVDALVKAAYDQGYIVTVEQHPLKPLAMGNYQSVVEVRAIRCSEPDKP